MISLAEPVSGMTCHIFPHKPCHGSVQWSLKQTGVFVKESGGQDEIPLLDHDLTILNSYSLGPQIRGKAVLFSVQLNHADDSCKPHGTQWNLCDRQHQRTILKAALGPYILFRKGASAISFDISCVIQEAIVSSVDTKPPVYLVPHAEHAVLTLHKRNIAKGTHDVIADRRKRLKPKITHSRKGSGVYVQLDFGFTKDGISRYGAGSIASYFSSLIGQGNGPMLPIPNDLE